PKPTEEAWNRALQRSACFCSNQITPGSHRLGSQQPLGSSFVHTMYSTRFDADDVVHRLLTLVQIFAAAAMAANAKQDLADRDSAGFGAAYAVQRVVLVIQYLRARREQRTRRLTTIYATGFGIAA